MTTETLSPEDLQDRLLVLARSLYCGQVDLDDVQEAMESTPEAELLAVKSFLDKLGVQKQLESLPDNVYLGDSKTW